MSGGCQCSSFVLPVPTVEHSSNSLLLYFLPNLQQPQPQPPQLPLAAVLQLRLWVWVWYGEPSFYRNYGIVEQKVQLNRKMEIVNGLLHLAKSAAN
jgi:AP2-like factor (ANT lineage)